ncbi:MAG: hypothetical protein MK538_05060 [Planctomycetes bacterium]|nr:hypothetical protein [Planctomycetota bacterium]
MRDSIDKLKNSLAKLEKWVEDHDYRAYEPFDGLSSKLRPLTFGNEFCERLLQQLVRQSPINLRPLLGVRPQDSTKGKGYMAWGYVDMYKLTGNEEYKEKAVTLFDWLDKNRAPGYDHHGWANHFDFTSRGGRLPKHRPIIVWTSLIGRAYLDAFETFEDEKYLDIAKSVCSWILNVPREKTESGACLSYISEGQNSIHNSNMLGAGMLARAARFTGDSNYLEVAKEAMEYSCSRQRPDGSWWYGEREDMHWIDNFHTGYNLDSLKIYAESTDDRDYDDNLKRGFEYFKSNLFEETGRPKYYHNRAYPIDSQCASQAIESLAHFADYDEDSLDLGVHVANWTVDNMQDKSGYFYYRQYPGGVKAKAPMLHWAQATTYRGLALLIFALDKAKARSTASAV